MPFWDVWKPGKPKTKEERGIIPKSELPAPVSPFEIYRPPAGIKLPPEPAPGAPRTLEEAIVPEFERGSMYDPEPELFHEFTPVRATIPPPRSPIQSRIEKNWLDRLFDLDQLWFDIRSVKRAPEFKEALEKTLDPYHADPASAPVVLVAEHGPDMDAEIAIAIGISGEDLEKAMALGTRFLWREVLGPALDDIAGSIADAMPGDLPGWVEFGQADDGGFGLFYLEDALQPRR